MPRYHRRKLELARNGSLESLAHRQIDSLLRDQGHGYDLFSVPHAGYSIMVASTLSAQYLEEAAREARENARETNMSHEMIEAIRVRGHKAATHLTASDIWLIECIVREACKKQRRAEGSATG